MSRKSLIVGNWKMELSHKSQIELVRSLKQQIKGVQVNGDVVVCPSFTALPIINEELARSKAIAVGAQNMFWEERGAHTGQVSLMQIKPFVRWCIVGHSEVRAVMGVNDGQVVASAARLLAADVTPIVCIGETQQERESDAMVDKIHAQVGALLAGLDRASLVRSVIAYEPIWAIGSGNLPDPDDVSQIILLVRKLIAERHGQDLAERVRVLYGGSIKDDFCDQYVGGPLADGLLVGGASIHPQEFLSIVRKVEAATV